MEQTDIEMKGNWKETFWGSIMYRLSQGSSRAFVFQALVALVFCQSAIGQILQNGSFESDFAGWTASGNETISTKSGTTTDGTRSVRFNFGQLTPNGVLSQTFSTVSGVPYVLTFDVGAVSVRNSRREQSLEVTLQGSGAIITRTYSVRPRAGTVFATWRRA